MRLLEKLFYFLLGGVTAIALAAYLILAPTNLFTRLFRSSTKAFSEKVLVGPYPTEDDFKKFKEQGVTKIISLLEPKVIYEKELLEKETALATKYGLKFENYPMGSLFGQKLTEDYEKNAELAVKSIVDSNEISYIHCYLGVHRLKYVEDLLIAKGINAKVSEKVAERDPETLLLEKAEREFQLGHFSLALSTLNSLKSLNGNGMMLLAWTYFKLNRLDEAKREFQNVLKIKEEGFDPSDGHTGLGLISLRENNLASAELLFKIKLESNSEDPSANEGLGHTYLRLGNKVKAKQYFTKALSLAPDNQEIKEILSKF